jgi:ABC-2 type transport system ATP-binding protein
MIEVEALTRTFGEFRAVDDVSFTVQRGEIVGLLGHNGAGKTTIMRMITGFLEPTTGRVRIDGLEFGRDTRAIQRRIGYLPENCPAWPEMSVIEYLEYRAVLQDVPEEKRAAAIASALRRTALADRATAPIQTLSRGYRQRVGVAQAILHGPDIVILDEPTNGLDPTQIRHMRTLIRDLAEEATVIVSTHILQEVQAVCERVLILRAGRLAVDSRLDALQQAEGLSVTVDRDMGQRFAGLAEVLGVTRAADSGRFIYLLNAPAEMAPAVARAVADAGGSLFALEPRRQDLEAVFARASEETAGA